ncbi:MAG: hypothetical protein IJT91_00810 [Clostridia bacterium]|nr:hypothetical protein [Clostridia bacterium]
MKCLKMALALVLALAIAFVLPLQSMAAEGKYVSEVYVAYGKNAEEAKKTLQDKGFTPLEGNLNDGGKTYVMLGYKTTDDIRESVTDLAVMNMDGKYNTTEYSQILRSKEQKVAEMLTDFMAAVREYRVNLKAGKEKATVVRDLLNKLTDDDTGMKLGDLLNSETLQDKVGIKQSIEAENPDNLPNLLTIFMQGNSYLISMVESLLAISADTADNTWIDRFAQMDYDTLLDEVEDERPDLNTETKRVQFLDNEYGTVVSTLAPEVDQLRADLIGYEQTGLDINKATQEDINNAFGDVEAIEDEDEKAAIAQKILEWSEAGVIYECLKNYEGGNFAKGELLDFFKEESDDDERIYPMAAALSEGQRGGMEFMSLKSLIRFASLDPEKLTKELNFGSALSEIKSESVYKGINRDLFKKDDSIAYTDEATRTKNVASPQILSSEWMEENFLLLGLWTGAVLTGIGSVVCKEILKDLVNEKAYFMSHNSGDIAHADMWNRDYARIGWKYCGYACIVLSLLAAGITIYRMSQTEDVTLEPIPKYFVDTMTTADGTSYELYYEAVQCNRADYYQNKKQTGSSADLCADEGKQWLALYASKNSMAGNPLTPDFKYNTQSESPADMSGSIHMIGETGALNLAKEEYRNYSDLTSAYNSIKNIFTDQCKAYVFFKLSNTPKTYDESAGNMTASAFNGGMAAIFGFGGAAVGAILGVVVTVFVKKKKAES